VLLRLRASDNALVENEMGQLEAEKENMKHHIKVSYFSFITVYSLRKALIVSTVLQAAQQLKRIYYLVCLELYF